MNTQSSVGNVVYIVERSRKDGYCAGITPPDFPFSEQVNPQDVQFERPLEGIVRDYETAFVKFQDIFGHTLFWMGTGNSYGESLSFPRFNVKWIHERIKGSIGVSVQREEYVSRADPVDLNRGISVYDDQYQTLVDVVNQGSADPMGHCLALLRNILPTDNTDIRLYRNRKWEKIN